jgi:hypothetical protein
MPLGTNPAGAWVTVTVPASVPVGHPVLLDPLLEPLLEPPEQHVLLLLLPEDALLHDVVVARRLPNDFSPIPDASWGRTVTTRTKLAATMTPVRIHRPRRFMPTPVPPPGALASSDRTLPQWPVPGPGRLTAGGRPV